MDARASDDAADAPTDDTDDALDAASLAKLGYRELKPSANAVGCSRLGEEKS